MKIKYFEDFYTALLKFLERPDFESNEMNEKVYLDLDEAGILIGLINGHPLLKANISEVLFQQINRQLA